MRKEQALAFLNKLQGRGIRLGLERIDKFLHAIGSPEKRFKVVHVAGTNGKGSTAAMIESVLRKAGYRTGLYTSPHLVRLNERIQVSGRQVSDRQLFKLVGELKNEMERSRINLTYFEFLTALAFKHFANCKIDFAVVEVGMGGRLDATNVVKPLVSVITNIEKEHEQFLGTTVERIAAEKAGIIKRSVPVVTAEWKNPVLNVFREQCRKKNAKLVVVKKPFQGKLGLLGFFQRWNAATAIAAVKELRKQGFAVREKAIADGLEAVKWPGRFEVVKRKPAVVLDCCHNPGCAFVVAKAFREAFPGKKAILVIGVSSGKNIGGIAALLSPIAGSVIATEAKFRAMSAERIKKQFEKDGLEAAIVLNLPDAVKRAIGAAGGNGIVLVTGSCFVVGEAMPLFQN